METKGYGLWLGPGKDLWSIRIGFSSCYITYSYWGSPAVLLGCGSRTAGLVGGGPASGVACPGGGSIACGGGSQLVRGMSVKPAASTEPAASKLTPGEPGGSPPSAADMNGMLWAASTYLRSSTTAIVPFCVAEGAR